MLQRKYDEAEKAFREAIELAPTDATPWLHLGRVLTSLRRYAEAEKAFRRAIELDAIGDTGACGALPNIDTWRLNLLSSGVTQWWP